MLIVYKNRTAREAYMFFFKRGVPYDDDTHECPDCFLDELKIAFSPKLGERGKNLSNKTRERDAILQLRATVGG